MNATAPGGTAHGTATISRADAAANSGLGPWIQYARPLPSAGTVLVCFPYAGGAASAYRSWAGALADHGIEVWPVQLPGRENRFGEPLIAEMVPLLTAVSGLLADRLDGRRYAVYGHSAGVVMACALAAQLATAGRLGPSHLFLGACRPPGRPDPDFPIHLLGHDQILTRLFGYGRVPAAVLDYPELVDSMIATARADLHMVETYQWPAAPLTDCPVTVFGGVQDAAVPVGVLPDWQEWTRGPFDAVLLPGGHFPGPDAEPRILEVIRRGLR